MFPSVLEDMTIGRLCREPYDQGVPLVPSEKKTISHEHLVAKSLISFWYHTWEYSGPPRIRDLLFCIWYFVTCGQNWN
jgi:hypothetical protein